MIFDCTLAYASLVSAPFVLCYLRRRQRKGEGREKSVPKRGYVGFCIGRGTGFLQLLNWSKFIDSCERITREIQSF